MTATAPSPHSQPPAAADGAGRTRLPGWRREALRTTLWLVPALCILGAVGLFIVSYALDQAAYNGTIHLPWWIRTSSADAGREVLIGIAAAVITVVGLVFSITIVALTLASQQFGPRMLRNFIRDIGTQVTLGVFVASFVYAVLTLGAITSGGKHGDFVPHIGITVSEALMFVDIGVLIYFIHHIAVTIQLPEVIARVARDLGRAIDEAFPVAYLGAVDGSASDVSLAGPAARADPVAAAGAGPSGPSGPSVLELNERLDHDGLTVPATRSGYLQFVGYGQLLAIAERTDTVIRLAHRPGHFIVAGRPLAAVWPSARAREVSRALAKGHITGPQRTLAQDPVFPIDQLAEIAIRALSPAVNDTFTALTCIDWLADGLCKISGREIAEGVYRDRNGRIRLIELDPSYARMVNRAIDKIRQAARGMPAVLIRLMDGLVYVTEYTTGPAQRQVLARQADMILRAAEETIHDPEDLAGVSERHTRMRDIAKHLDAGSSSRHWQD
jgi:uncharacterized membrane protein